MVKWIMGMAGITLLFYFGGVLSNTASSTLLDMALRPAELQSSSLFLKILSVTSLTAAVISTFVARNQNSDFYLMVPIVTVFFSFGWDFLNVYTAMASAGDIGQFVAVLFFGPLMIGYVISVVEWWRGIVL
jgi:hypothetical protein